MSRKNCGGLLAARASRSRASQGWTCVQNFARSNFVAGVEQQDVDALPGEVPGRHAARRAAADDDDGVDLGRVDDLHGTRKYDHTAE